MCATWLFVWQFPIRRNVIALRRLCMHDKMVLISIFSGCESFADAGMFILNHVEFIWFCFVMCLKHPNGLPLVGRPQMTWKLCSLWQWLRFAFTVVDCAGVKIQDLVLKTCWCNLKLKKVYSLRNFKKLLIIFLGDRRKDITYKWSRWKLGTFSLLFIYSTVYTLHSVDTFLGYRTLPIRK